MRVAAKREQFCAPSLHRCSFTRLNSNRTNSSSFYVYLTNRIIKQLIYIYFYKYSICKIILLNLYSNPCKIIICVGLRWIMDTVKIILLICNLHSCVKPKSVCRASYSLQFPVGDLTWKKVTRIIVIEVGFFKWKSHTIFYPLRDFYALIQ